MSDCPLVSVIMGIRYTSRDTGLLERSVRSVLDQSYRRLELLICDDGGSSPEAEVYLERASAQDGRVRLLHDARCQNLAKKLNLCLGSASGVYIARMDDDDWSHPDRLEKQVRFLNTDKSVDFVGCNVSLVQNGLMTGKREFPPRPKVEDFFFVQPYTHSALMFRAEALAVVGGYSERNSCASCEDYDLLLRMYAKGMQGANMQERLLDYTANDAKGNRTMKHRLNEVVTRYRRFRELGRLPRALPYVVKPVVVGLLPAGVVKRLKERKYERAGY